ncbi:MAG: DUF4838 domain-containing protein [Proteiniphilum sp.]|nr:DUF4838 domain-containing protein [Proteiniphilum sp.]
MRLHNYIKRRKFLTDLLLSATNLSIIPHFRILKANIQRKEDNLLIIADDGKSEYSILLNTLASKSEEFAAQELAHYIEKCTGVRMEIKRGWRGKVHNPHAIMLGHGDVSAHFGIKNNTRTWGEQGFTIETVGKILSIAGTPGAGTLYGVYHFLERYVGIRWYAPGVTKINPITTIRIPFIKENITPSFLYREPYYTWPGKDQTFLTSLRVNVGLRDEKAPFGLGYAFVGMAHTYFHFVSPDEYFDSNPEYFSEIGGKRIREETQLCLTNDEVFEIVATRMLDMMHRHPSYRQFNFSQMDYYNGCQCEKCRKVNEKYGSDGATQFEFVSKLAARTSKEFPNKLIGTLAYMYTEKVPQGMIMHPNVAVWLCHMHPCCDSHSIENCIRNREYRDRAISWSGICAHLYIWHYIVDFAHYYNPYPNFRAMAADMRFYNEIGVEGIFAQGMGDVGGGGEFSLLRGYYCAKLLWDATQDPDEILKDFLQGYYGPAWEPLWQYINLIHDEVEQKNIHLHLYVNPGHGHLSDEIIRHAEHLFNQAEAKVAHDLELIERVKIARMPVEYSKMFPRNGYQITSTHLRFKGEISGPTEVENFTQRMEKHGFIKLREVLSDQKQLLALSHLFTSGMPVVTLDNKLLSVIVVPALAGRVLQIIDNKSGRCVTTHNKVASLWFPFSGGHETRVGETTSFMGFAEPAEVISRTTNSVTTRATLGNGLILERHIRLNEREKKMYITTHLINSGTTPQEARLRSHLELELGKLRSTEIFFTNQAGQKKSPTTAEIISGMREGIHYYKDELPAGSWHFRSDGLELVHEFNQSKIEMAKVYAYPKDLENLELELWHPVCLIDSESRCTFEETIMIYP